MPAAAVTILVINPSSSVPMTDGISRGLAPLRFPGAPDIVCVNDPGGPHFIATPDHIAFSAPRVVDLALAHPAAAYVVACYAEPGLDELRTRVAVPVIGIHDAAVATALTLGARFGVIAMSEAAIPRHIARLQARRLADRLVGEVALAAPHGASDDETATALADAGRALKAMGADSVIIGCAGLSHHRTALAAAIGLPVVEPTLAAVGMALAALT